MTNLSLNDNRVLHKLPDFHIFDNNAILFFDESKNKEVALSYETLQHLSANFTKILLGLTNNVSQVIGIFGEQNELITILILG